MLRFLRQTAWPQPCHPLTLHLQVSCGPFHCAAVSSDGRLFTWGEGFGGKLGHGDQGNRSHPALVQALAMRQVRKRSAGCRVLPPSAVLLAAWLPANGFVG